jgi:NADH-quinone oxidoreductase subunit L
MTFYGKSNMSKSVEEHVHESPMSILIPLLVLALLAILGGFIGFPTASAINSFLAPVIGGGHHGMVDGDSLHHVSKGLMFSMMGISTGIAVAGILIAYLMYIKNPDLPAMIVGKFRLTYKIIYNKYYVDEIYDATIVKPTVKTSFILWRIVDVKIIDGFVNAIARIVELKGEVLKLFQTGYVRNYALSILLGGVIIIVCSLVLL